jgi:drug/metabolite transporter (DMT)-like permease
MNVMQTRLLGTLLVVASALFFSIAGVFTKMADANAWAVAGWRGLVGSLLIGVYALWRRRRETDPHDLWPDRRGWVMVAISVVAGTLYITALKFTYVANVAVIYATTPFIAAGLAWLMLKERIGPMTVFTAVLSMIGVIVTVINGLGAANAMGDSLAIVTTILFAIYVVCIRAWQDTPVNWTAAIASLLVFALSCIMTDPLAMSQRDMLICTAFGFTFALAMIFMAEGARLLPVAETALIGTLDVPFAIGFAWLLLAELPPANSLVGGAIVVAAIVLQGSIDAVRRRWALRASRASCTP